MSERGTAALGHVVAGVRSRFRRSVLVAGTACGIGLTALVPAAVARGRSCPHARTPIAAASRPALQRAVVCLINRQRTERGLPALRISPLLNRSAQGWTDVMVSHRRFSHGADFATRISAVGFSWSSVGENIATGFPTAAAVVSGWMASAEHCQNILSPAFTDVGTGVSDRSITSPGGGGGTWTQDFGLPGSAHVRSSNYGPADSCPY